MNKFYTVKTFLTLFFVAVGFISKSQTIILGGNPARFGLDADVSSDTFAFGTLMPSAPGSDDWFKKNGGLGLGVIDTSGAAKARSFLQSGKDYIFDLPANHPRFSLQNGNLFLDARYARDGAMQDSTYFSGNAQNAQDPTTWPGSKTIGTVLDKCDIVDTYIHLRRDGPKLTAPNQNHLFLMLGASMVATNGSHYMDFELFKERVYFTKSEGKFYNSGPSWSGGHSTWEFNDDGSVAEMGDMQISFTFNNTDVTSTNIYIWVPLAIYNTVKPQKFSFVPNSFNVGTLPGYGYAEITSLQSGAALPVWGIVNSGMVPAPAWGTTSKEIGAASNNYFSTNYAPGQFAEVAIDFTAFGTDPAFNPYNNPCQPPFTRLIAKTRSSGAFAAALKDFTGPYPFLEDFTPAPDIIPPAHLTCDVTTLDLSPATVQTPGVYEWSTNNGNIITGNTDTSYIKINKAGMYVLKTRTYKGCSSKSDSVDIKADDHKPIAKAGGPYYLTPMNPIAQLEGGDPAASNYSTPFGNSKGLTWKWAGPNNYMNNTQYSDAADTGTYTLTVTELRNGCSASVSTTVTFLSTLPIKLSNFSAVTIDWNTIDVRWQAVSETGNEYYMLERSIDGINFTYVNKFVSAGSKSFANYGYRDNSIPRIGTVLYRVKIYYHNTLYSTSAIIKINLKNPATTQVTAVLQNAPGSNILIKFYAVSSGNRNVKVFGVDGTLLFQTNVTMIQGINPIEIDAHKIQKAGIKMLHINNKREENINYKFLLR